MRVGLVVAAAACIAVAGTLLPLPWTHGPTGPVVYGVTRNPDGSVLVLVTWAQTHSPATLQAALRAADVPAVVIRDSPHGTCPYTTGGDPGSIAAVGGGLVIRRRGKGSSCDRVCRAVVR